MSKISVPKAGTLANKLVCMYMDLKNNLKGFTTLEYNGVEIES